MDSVTIVLPPWFVYLLAITLSLQAVSLVLDFVIKYLNRKLKKLRGGV
jgi:uncharacterized membrane protein YwaF